jgi:hypothetical protein
MAITRWHPDTCGCILEYEDAEIGKTVIRSCDLHAAAGDALAIHAAVLAHNRFKNAVQGHVQDAGDKLGIQDAHDIGFSYAKDGTLQMAGPIDDGAKAALQAELAAKFGADMVKVI